jgi:hypothetical protein
MIILIDTEKAFDKIKFSFLEVYLPFIFIYLFCGTGA